jgi:hypothetical protein
MLKPGDTFIAPLTSRAIEHLWIVITAADAEGKAVAVNVTTRRSFSETTVILNEGDHPFVKHPSVINYTDAQFIDLKAVEKAIEKATQKFRLQTPSTLLARLIEEDPGGHEENPISKKTHKAAVSCRMGRARNSC